MESSKTTESVEPNVDVDGLPDSGGIKLEKGLPENAGTAQRSEEERKEKFSLGGNGDGGSDDDEKPKVHPGVTMLGIIMTVSSFYFIYVGEYIFSMYLFALLVVLALGSKYFND